MGASDDMEQAKSVCNQAGSISTELASIAVTGAKDVRELIGRLLHTRGGSVQDPGANHVAEYLGIAKEKGNDAMNALAGYATAAEVSLWLEDLEAATGKAQEGSHKLMVAIMHLAIARNALEEASEPYSGTSTDCDELVARANGIIG